jgi:hypothetical protein
MTTDVLRHRSNVGVFGALHVGAGLEVLLNKQEKVEWENASCG